jgi:hypothetical protein
MASESFLQITELLRHKRQIKLACKDSDF